MHKDGLNSYCKNCHKEYAKRDYIKNKERYSLLNKERNDSGYNKKYTKIRSDRGRAYNETFRHLKEKPCTDCKNTFPPICMHFDHLDPTTKVNNVSTMIFQLRPVDEILKEISKCELVCANCHFNREYIRKNMKKLGGIL